MKHILKISALLCVLFLVGGTACKKSDSTGKGKKNVKKILSSNDTIVETELKRISEQMNKTLPKKLDQYTTLASTKAGPGRRLAYYYTIYNLPKKNMNQAFIESKMKAKLANNYKTNPSMAGLRSRKVILTYVYKDKSGKQAAKFDIQP